MNLVTVIAECTSAASAADGELRVVYVAAARSNLERLKTRVAELELLVSAQETEIARLSSVGEPDHWGPT